jgi:uncharacterized DUF497 family protein
MGTIQRPILQFLCSKALFCNYVNYVEINFDPTKRERTLRERGLDFALAAEVFGGLTATVEDARFYCPEPRLITAGHLAGRLVVLVWTPTSAGRRIVQ